MFDSINTMKDLNIKKKYSVQLREDLNVVLNRYKKTIESKIEAITVSKTIEADEKNVQTQLKACEAQRSKVAWEKRKELKSRLKIMQEERVKRRKEFETRQRKYREKSREDRMNWFGKYNHRILSSYF